MANNNKIKSSVLAIAMVCTSMAATAGEEFQTERDLQPEYIGIGGGVVAGALVGGPVGAIAGAIVGALVGQSVSLEDHNKNQQQHLDSVIAKNTELEAISDQYNQSQIEIARLRMAEHEKLLDLDLDMNIQFRTGSAEIEPHFRDQLDELAGLMVQSPSVHWQLEGHADVRGNKNYNLTLSQKRVQAVFDYLVEQGVAGEQLSQTAFGTQMTLAEEGDREGYSFDRRVNLRSSLSNSQTASY